MIRKFFGTVALGSLFVGGLAASHLAFAQPEGPAGPGRHGGMMMMADTNKDGALTKAEVMTALEGRFAKMDVDKDGKLTPQDRDAMRAQRLDTRFAALDADKNGQVSKAEFTTQAEARAERRAEAGKPGGPDGKRWGGGHRGGHDRAMMFGGPGRGDADKDGTVTKAAFMAGPIAMFDKADANTDGQVTADEMKAARQAMRGAWKDRKAPPPPPAS